MLMVPIAGHATTPAAVPIMTTGPMAVVAMVRAAMVPMAIVIVVMMVVMTAGVYIAAVPVAVSAIPVAVAGIAVADANAQRAAVDAAAAVITIAAVSVVIAAIAIAAVRVITIRRGVVAAIGADVVRRHDAATQKQKCRGEQRNFHDSIRNGRIAETIHPTRVNSCSGIAAHQPRMRDRTSARSRERPVRPFSSSSTACAAARRDGSSLCQLSKALARRAPFCGFSASISTTLSAMKR